MLVNPDPPFVDKLWICVLDQLVSSHLHEPLGPPSHWSSFEFTSLFRGVFYSKYQRFCYRHSCFMTESWKNSATPLL